MQITSDTPRLGLGCWPLSGAFYADDRPLGYANADPAESLRALDAAYANGIRLFDTAAVYGAGKGERLVGKALKGKQDVTIVTKIGMGFDEASERITDSARTSLNRLVRRLTVVWHAFSATTSTSSYCTSTRLRWAKPRCSSMKWIARVRPVKSAASGGARIFPPASQPWLRARDSPPSNMR